MFNAIDEFFRRTLSWRYFTEVVLAEGIVDYTLSVPADTTVVRMIGVTHKGMPMQPLGTGVTAGTPTSSVGRYTSELVFPDGDTRIGPESLGPPVGASSFSYSIYRPEAISITTPPGAEMAQYPLEAIMALTLSTGSLENDCGEWALEDWMYEAFFNDWFDGTLARLYGMPAKPWASPVLAQMHGRRFRNQTAYRKQESNRGFNYGVKGWVYPRTGW
jgi:hypothetical protein